MSLRNIASLTRLRRPDTAPAVEPSVAASKNEPPQNVPKPDPEPPVSQPASPLTSSTKAVQATKRSAGPKPGGPNLVLPTFEDTFERPPRSWPPRVGVLERTLSAVNSYLFSKPPDLDRMRRPSTGGKKISPEEEAASRLPKAWGAMNDKERHSSRGTSKIASVVVIGVHGWFTQGLLKTVMGEPTGTSEKLASMGASAIFKHFKDADLDLNPEAVTVIPLSGDGRVADRVDRLFATLLSNKSWVDALLQADALLIASHSQGAPVSTHLLARLIEQKHVLPHRTRVCLLTLCGIHNGPFAHLQGNLAGSYLHYFESAAAKELFEFQSSNNGASQRYTASLHICLAAGAKMVYIASVDDQVVPLYSALNSAVSHPSILRALYVDGQAFPRTDFLINLLTFCVAVRNAGASDHGLLTLLSSSVAGSLYGGAGHSSPYNEPAAYELAVRYLFEVTSPLSEPTMRHGEDKLPTAEAEPFEAQRWNPYQLPWALRGLLEDSRVRKLFGDHISKLLDDFDQWKPVTKTLRDVQFRLHPMTLIKRPDPPSSNETALLASSSAASSIAKTTPRL